MHTITSFSTIVDRAESMRKQAYTHVDNEMSLYLPGYNMEPELYRSCDALGPHVFAYALIVRSRLFERINGELSQHTDALDLIVAIHGDLHASIDELLAMRGTRNCASPILRDQDDIPPPETAPRFSKNVTE